MVNHEATAAFLDNPKKNQFGQPPFNCILRFSLGWHYTGLKNLLLSQQKL